MALGNACPGSLILLRRSVGTERFDDPSRAYDLEAAEAFARVGDTHPDSVAEIVKALRRPCTSPPTLPE